jgi:hypothetical protein
MNEIMSAELRKDSGFTNLYSRRDSVLTHGEQISVGYLLSQGEMSLDSDHCCAYHQHSEC